jgi:hypothetical protein
MLTYVECLRTGQRIWTRSDELLNRANTAQRSWQGQHNAQLSWEFISSRFVSEV